MDYSPSDVYKWLTSGLQVAYKWFASGLQVVCKWEERFPFWYDLSPRPKGAAYGPQGLLTRPKGAANSPQGLAYTTNGSCHLSPFCSIFPA